MDFYAMEADTDEEGRIINFRYKKDHRGRSWIEGVRFDPNIGTSFFKATSYSVVIYLDSKNLTIRCPRLIKPPSTFEKRSTRSSSSLWSEKHGCLPS